MSNTKRNEVTPILPIAPVQYTATTTTGTNGGLQQPHQQQSGRRRVCWENYMTAIEKYPIRTKCITALIIFVAADVFAQMVEYELITTTTIKLHDDRPNTIVIFSAINIDWVRTLRFGALGLFGAPWSHYYFYWLDYYLPPSDEPFTKRTAMKVGIDQFIQAPILLAIMIFALGFMKGQGLYGAIQDLSDTFVMSLIANWKLWIPASIINIAFVKPTLRVLFVNVVFFFWTIILSLMLNKSAS